MSFCSSLQKHFQNYIFLFLCLILRLPLRWSFFTLSMSPFLSMLQKHGLSQKRREVPQWMLYQSAQESEEPLTEIPSNHEYYLWQSPLCVQYFQIQACAVCSSLLKSINKGYFYLDLLETWDDQNKIKRIDCLRQHFTRHWHCISNLKTAMEDRCAWRRTVQSLITTLVK